MTTIFYTKRLDYAAGCLIETPRGIDRIKHAVWDTNGYSYRITAVSGREYRPGEVKTLPTPAHEVSAFRFDVETHHGLGEAISSHVKRFPQLLINIVDHGTDYALILRRDRRQSPMHAIAIDHVSSIAHAIDALERWEALAELGTYDG